MGVQLSKMEQSRPLRLRESTIEGLRLMSEASPRWFWLLMVGTTVLGTLPTVFTIASGQLVAIAQEAAGGGLEGSLLRRFLFMLAVVAVVSLAQDGGGSVQRAFVDGFGPLVDARRRERVIAATLAPHGVDHLEDPEVLDRVRLAARADWIDSGHFALGVYGMVITRVGGLCSAVVVGVLFRWDVAVGLLVLWLWCGRVMRLGQYESWDDTAKDLRRASYYRDLAFEPDAAKEVRIFGIAGWLLDAYSGAWTRIMREVWRRRGANRPKQLVVLAVVTVGNALAFAMVAGAARRGDLTVAELVVVVPSMMALAWLGEMGMFTIGISVGAVALPPMVELEKRLAPIQTRSEPLVSADHLPTQEIVFEDVGFTYPRSERPVYEHLDLRIPAGRSLAIVGANGAGKTTLVKLLARLHDPTAGRITVDGIDLQDVDPRSWQRRVAAVFQDFVHYDLSAEDNVGFGAPHLANDRDAIERAAARVGALDLVRSLPEGWNTVLSRRYAGGVDLSGGQWQRLALARALFALEGGAGVLVLDEPTASLDVRGEVETFDRFLEVTSGATTIVISHRFSTVRRADRIVVLRDGRVAEEGTHAELVASGGLYSRSFRLQASRYDDIETMP